MKSLTVIKKNLKLLARSKGSAAVVMLAPLIIVLIIGFGFTDNGDTTINLGIYTNETTELTQRFISNLNTTENNIIPFNSQDDCIEGIKEGYTVACIVFPDNFVIADNSQNEVIFFIDESRTNLVYQLVASLSLNLDLETEEVSQELTSQLLGILTKTTNNVDSSITTIIGLKSKTQSTKDKSSQSTTTLKNLDTQVPELDISTLKTDVLRVSDAYGSIKPKANDVLNKGEALVKEINGSVSTSTFETSLSALNTSMSNAAVSVSDTEQLKKDIVAVEKEINAIEDKLKASDSAKNAVVSNLGALSSSLDDISKDLDVIKVKQERISADINSFDLKNANSIVNPITTKIEPVTAKNTRITYAFPYLLMLIILFVGVMLSSTLVFMEKDSRAFFRTFTTPARSVFFVWMTYFTSAMVIALQVALVLFVVYFGLDVPVFSNISMSLLIIFLSLSTFIFLGMFIGYLFNTNEAITMSTITIGSVLLFLSNLILPTETLGPAMQKIIAYNPYVIASESLRKTMLFEAPFKNLSSDMLMLLGYSIIIFGVMMLVIKISSSKYLSTKYNIHKLHEITVPEDHYLKIPEFKLVIKDLHDLSEALETLTDEDYKKLIKEKNIFAEWVKLNYKSVSLTGKVRFKSRKKIIKAIEKYDKKHIKK